MKVIHQITTTNMSEFDGVEIHGINSNDAVCTSGEIAVKFAVFTHQKEGGAVRVAESPEYDEAHGYATELGDECDWPVRDFSGR